MSAECNFTVCFRTPKVSFALLGVHSKADFTFEELTFFVNETEEDYFRLEGFTSGYDESLESIDLGASCRRCRRMCFRRTNNVIIMSQGLTSAQRRIVLHQLFPCRSMEWELSSVLAVCWWVVGADLTYYIVP